MREFLIKTERVGFSVWRNDDIELAKSLWGEPEVTHYLCVTGAFTEKDIQERLKLEICNYQKFNIQYYPIFDLRDYTLIGCCGLKPFEGELDILEIGVHLRKEYWGQGFAVEAIKAIIEYSFLVLHVKELRAGHHPLNIASKKTLLKLGFQYAEDCYYEPTGLDHPLYALVNSEGE